MVASFLLIFREGFEATLLVAIVLAYLVRIGRSENKGGVWYGVAGAVILSVAVGAIMFATASNLTGDAAEIFKGGAMWFAVAMLTYMILWMRRQSRTVAQDIRHGVDQAVGKGSSLALAILAFAMVFREGLETALFMFSVTQTSSPLQVAVGGTVGLAAAVALGYAVYVGGKRINLGTFFKVTDELLRVTSLSIQLLPVFVREAGTHLPDSLTKLFVISALRTDVSAPPLQNHHTRLNDWRLVIPALSPAIYTGCLRGYPHRTGRHRRGVSSDSVYRSPI